MPSCSLGGIGKAWAESCSSLTFLALQFLHCFDYFPQPIPRTDSPCHYLSHGLAIAGAEAGLVAVELSGCARRASLG